MAESEASSGGNKPSSSGIQDVIMSTKTRLMAFYLPMAKERCQNLTAKLTESFHGCKGVTVNAYECASSKVRLWFGDVCLTTTMRRVRRFPRSAKFPPFHILLILLAVVAIIYLLSNRSGAGHHYSIHYLPEDRSPFFVYPRVFNNPERDSFMYGTFPNDFLWGVATSAHQIEGSGNVYSISGKGQSIWDTFSRQPGAISNGDSADIACDSYNKYKEDVELLKLLGVKFYRFSLSWSRIMPDGTMATINEAGIKYYNNLIDALLEAGIIPMVTLYHWDLPQALQDKYGGWADEAIIRDFNTYARLCFERFGNRVKYWITINEPWVITELGYGRGVHAPGLTEDGTTTYMVAHNLIKSHAKVWHTYDDEFRVHQRGKVGLALNSEWVESGDARVADRMLQFMLGWFAHPIFVNGDYPEIMKVRIAAKSHHQGLNNTRLPEFTKPEQEYIRGTADFLGLNHYTSVYVTENPVEDNYFPPSWEKDHNLAKWYGHSWPSSGSSWLKVVPWGMRRLLEWIKKQYNNPPVIITENGFSSRNVYDLNDLDRVGYLMAYIDEVLKAIELDQVNVKGYAAWSLMDNFEWSEGYTERFGLFYVDFEDEERPRIQKDSAVFYSQVVHDNGFPSSAPLSSASNHLALYTQLLFVISVWFSICF
ncbi:cytosolic beta-glucosidase-like [Ptychodera flava]|uniref:cytosolic beta-glucosidase-like n=1 Tax=Ptychodera flava TaxID=63121 RepID=UPI00396A035F